MMPDGVIFLFFLTLGWCSPKQHNDDAMGNCKEHQSPRLRISVPCMMLAPAAYE